MGTRSLVDDQDFLAWLRTAGSAAPLVTSVCTGSALLAAAGLLDGYAATSNKRAFAWASGFGQSVAWRPAARWVHDRDRWTSSGVAAGMDLTAALIAHIRGEEQAVLATQLAEYEPHRDSEHDPFAHAWPDAAGLASAPSGPRQQWSGREPIALARDLDTLLDETRRDVDL